MLKYSNSDCLSLLSNGRINWGVDSLSILVYMWKYISEGTRPRRVTQSGINMIRVGVVKRESNRHNVNSVLKGKWSLGYRVSGGDARSESARVVFCRGAIRHFYYL